MQTSVHTPERQPGEAQPEHRARQRRSRQAVDAMTLRGLSGAANARKAQRDQKRQAGTLGSGHYGRGLRRHFERASARKAPAA